GAGDPDELRYSIAVDISNDGGVRRSVEANGARFVGEGRRPANGSEAKTHDLRPGQHDDHREPRDGRGAASARDRGGRHARGSIPPPNRSGIMPDMAPPRVLWSPPED